MIADLFTRKTEPQQKRKTQRSGYIPNEEDKVLIYIVIAKLLDNNYSNKEIRNVLAKEFPKLKEGRDHQLYRQYTYKLILRAKKFRDELQSHGLEIYAKSNN